MYGKNLGEIVASGRSDGATPPVLSKAYNIASTARAAKGSFSMTLVDGIAPTDCTTFAISESKGNIATVNEGGADTATVKQIRIQLNDGTDADTGYQFFCVRTKP
jgi:hypothetical protein